MRRRALTGIQPSGTPHIGNYLGAIRPGLAMQESHDCFFFIASYHSLTSQRDPVALREQIRVVAASWLALGLDPERTVLWAQHDVPEVTELTWVLSTITSKGLLDKGHAFKDAASKGNADVVNVGLFLYPVLMAADILAFNSHVVPVGQDQKQHLEMTRDIAERFNRLYGDTLQVPDPLIQEEVATVVGLDGQKMSKSRGNGIEIWLPPKQLRKKVMAIATDSTPMEEPKDPTTCTVFKLYSLFAAPEDTLALAERYRGGNFGYGHAKQALFEVLDAHFAEPRERYEAILAHPSRIDEVLDAGALRARAVARETLSQVRDRVGLGRMRRA
jgi:tryptophanyl-tRNA synthetase